MVRSPLSAPFLLAALASLGAGQEPSADLTGRTVYVTGQVIDQVTERPVASARVSLRQPGGGAIVWQGAADPEGWFRVGRFDLGSWEIGVEALGFATLRHPVTFEQDGAAEIQIELSPEALELEPIVVTASRQSRLEAEGFFERRRSGHGYTLIREEIAAAGLPSRVTDIFRRMPGVQVVASRNGFTAALRLRQGCTPRLVLNGTLLTSGVTTFDDVLSAQDVEAVEVYHSATAPIRYGSNGCGVVMAWTREFGRIEGRPWSWRRIAVAVGFVGAVLLFAN